MKYLHVRQYALHIIHIYPQTKSPSVSAPTHSIRIFSLTAKLAPPSPQITKNTTIPTFGFRIEYIVRIMLYAYARLVSATNTSHHPMKSVRRLNRHRLVSRSGDIDGKLARDIILIGIPTTVINLAALWKF